MTNIHEISEEDYVQDDMTVSVIQINNTELIKFDDKADEYDSVEENKQLRLFKKRRLGQLSMWLEMMITNLKQNNLTVVECINNPDSRLYSQLYFTSSCLDLDEHGPGLFVQGSPNIATKAPVNGRTVTTVGKYMKGGLKLFYFFDIVTMRRGKGQFGEYIMMRWNNIQRHNSFYSKVVCHKFDCEDALLSDTAFISVPLDNTINKANFVKKFYEISMSNNRYVYSQDKLDKVVACEEMTVDRFNELLYLGEDPSDKKTGYMSDTECSFLMGAIVEGFKCSKAENQYAILNGKNSTDYSYSLAVVPQILFYIESGSKRARVELQPECIIQESL